MSHKVHYMTHYGCFWVWIQFYVRKSVIYNTFSNIKKEQPIFQGCSLILSNPTRQDVEHQPLHGTRHARPHTQKLVEYGWLRF